MIRQHRGVTIDGPNYAGMYSALVPINRTDNVKVAADTVKGIRAMISDVLNHGPKAVGL
jgi:hypothetical protein